MANFILDSSVLAGSQFSPRFKALENGGEARAFQYQVQDTTNNSDIEIHSLATGLTVDAESEEND